MGVHFMGVHFVCILSCVFKIRILLKTKHLQMNTYIAKLFVLSAVFVQSCNSVNTTLFAMTAYRAFGAPTELRAKRVSASLWNSLRLTWHFFFFLYKKNNILR
jgi:hypothetical protein